MNFKDITLADVSVETKVETLGIALDKKIEELYNTVSTVESVVGPQGVKGDKGDTGPAGAPGRDGVDGKDGKDGVGTDGEDGEDGVGVSDVDVDLDGRLLVTLTDGTVRKSAKEIVGPQGPRGVPGADGRAGADYTVSTNPTFTYTNGALTSIAYGSGESKVFTYTSGLLTRLDFTRNGVTIRKTFNYTSGVLTSITQVTL